MTPEEELLAKPVTRKEIVELMLGVMQSIISLQRVNNAVGGERRKLIDEATEKTTEVMDKLRRLLTDD